MNGVFRLNPLQSFQHSPIFTSDDLVNIKRIGHKQDAFDLLAESLAPSIYGHQWITKAAILQLLRGMETNLKNGTHIWGYCLLTYIFTFVICMVDVQQLASNQGMA